MERADLNALYRSESRDHLERLGRAVLAMERGAGKPAVDEAFRCAHTLKGMSAAMGHESVVGLAHGLEHVLEGVRAGTVLADPQVVDLLFAGVDELERVIASALAGRVAAGGGSETTPGRTTQDSAPALSEGESGRYVRVEQERIDSLMNRAGEMVVARERLFRLARAAADPEIEEVVAGLARSFAELRDDALRLRLAPVGELADRLQRLVRDSGRSLGKQIQFDISGGRVEIDRGLLGDLSDLLTHLLRNAVDHGIESADERKASLKPESGSVRVVVSESRDLVVVRVQDDGRGIDPTRVMEQAVARGLRPPGASSLTESELLDLLVLPGFSTSASITAMSGRGVGLDHVASRLKDLGGELRLSTAAGTGATFTIALPKTLSLTRVLIVGCGEELLAIPLGAVERLEDEIGDWENLVPGSRRLDAPQPPIEDIGELCGYPVIGPTVSRGFFIVLGKGSRTVRLRADSLFGVEDVVVKRFVMPRGVRDVFAGATIRSDGVPRLVVDPPRLMAHARQRGTRARTANL